MVSKNTGGTLLARVTTCKPARLTSGQKSCCGFNLDTTSRPPRASGERHPYKASTCYTSKLSCYTFTYVYLDVCVYNLLCLLSPTKHEQGRNIVAFALLHAVRESPCVSISLHQKTCRIREEVTVVMSNVSFVGSRSFISISYPKPFLRRDFRWS